MYPFVPWIFVDVEETPDTLVGGPSVDLPARLFHDMIEVTIDGKALKSKAYMKDGVRTGEIAECTICRGNWKIGEKVMITKCCHKFHRKCVGTWLTGPCSQNKNCPTCRSRLV